MSGNMFGNCNDSGTDGNFDINKVFDSDGDNSILPVLQLGSGEEYVDVNSECEVSQEQALNAQKTKLAEEIAQVDAEKKRLAMLDVQLESKDNEQGDESDEEADDESDDENDDSGDESEVEKDDSDDDSGDESEKEKES